jgi:hypothetical protein
VARRDLTPLSAALNAQGVEPLHVTQGEDGRWYATFESAREHTVPEEAICCMLEAVSSLTGKTRGIWSKCELREFNIGYDCGDKPWAFNDGLTNKTLLRIATVGASLRITLYPPAKRRKKKDGL